MISAARHLDSSFPWKTQYNSLPEEGEVNVLPSETVPDETMSIGEILKRFSTGNMPDVSQRQPEYYGDEFDIPNLATLDISERQQWANQIKATIEESRNRDRKIRELKEQQDRQKQISDEVEKRLKGQQPLGAPTA